MSGEDRERHHHIPVDLLIVPIVLLAGYTVDITRNVMVGEDRPLPKWEDFGILFRDGLAIIAASLLFDMKVIRRP